HARPQRLPRQPIQLQPPTLCVCRACLDHIVRCAESWFTKRVEPKLGHDLDRCRSCRHVSQDGNLHDRRSLAAPGFTVISEVRAPDTDPGVYADSVVSRICQLLASGVPPDNITVIGASKGSVIAMLVSSRLTAAIRYVLMASCNEYIFDTFALRLHGHVLSIYEASDELGQTCRSLFDRSPGIGERREVRLETGLRHGFIYRPLEAWVRPALAWARGDTDQ
ncbi:MAG: hypothetical protein ACRD2Z_04635, partial [Thermoanaerobaculia bacterium]